MLREGGEQAARAAALCTQLPAGSRVLRLGDPDQAWTVTDFLLRRIEHDLRLLAWDGKGERPAPIPAPGDARRAEEEAEEEAEAIRAVSAAIPGVI